MKGTHGMQAQCADLGPDGKPMGISRGLYGGTITVVDQEKGIGFIESQPIREQFGCDTQFTVEMITNNGKLTCHQGDVVRFELSPQLLSNRKLQALTVQRANQMPYVKQSGGKGSRKDNRGGYSRDNNADHGRSQQP